MKFETKVENKEKSIVEVKVTMPFSEVEKNIENVEKQLVESTEIEGFRKGKAPKEMVVAKLGGDKILQEASSMTINEAFPEILKKEKIKIIGYPAISVTKLAEGNDFEFTMEITVYPEVKLPDYKKLAKGVKKEVRDVKDEEIEKVIKNLLEMQNNMKKGSLSEEEQKDFKEETELTEDFIKQLGPYTKVEEFKKQVKDDLHKEAELQAVSEHRGKIAEAILEELKIEVPELLVNAEIDKILAQLKDDVQMSGSSFEDYLKKEGKDEVTIREHFRGEAEKRAKIEIVLKEIAKEEKISPDEKEVQKQVEQIAQTYKDVDLENIKLYVENIMVNDAVMKFLEEQK